MPLNPVPLNANKPKSPVPNTLDLLGDDLLGLSNPTPKSNAPLSLPAPKSVVNANAMPMASMSSVPPITKEFSIFDKNGLQIKLQLQAPTTFQVFNARAIFINVTPVPFTSLSFLVATPKVYDLILEYDFGYAKS